MPSFPVMIDTTVDFDPVFASKKAPADQSRNLLLAPPSIAAHEEKLRRVFTSFDRSTTDLQMLDRLSAGLVSLPQAAYDVVLVLTDADGAYRAEALQLLSRDVFNALVPAMKSGAKLQLQDGRLGQNDAREAILAGLVEKDGVFEKMVYEATVVPLRLGGRKKKPAARPILPSNDLGEYKDGDELIDEDDLLSEEDLKRPPVQEAANCRPEVAKKRRRACKDCTCGLAARLEAEDQERRAKADEDLNVFKLNMTDLNDEELDFTVAGKTSSCNNCSLGDAFRCDGCPFIGLPAFKPGEEVMILNNTVQL
ncbi:hypothetical protein ASPZODRAFT_902756 [Penicilliopsis zonata CBS 506.65]|uniref:Uncharacterized protein n=1 Tax=Penicilliopsis zonata CBS 506.65 TaxID=1073090 RepID=A0A1L9S8Z0_9EURO|nr:hypothetical protein ASPZODRAFT_902756 [Penicilliopsis zonata CBS 506.65]OJJ43626.1 hypothetical protein ASPZODRAFT_902756 [Penicilliopsis zonata CBS 506.65]